MSRSRWELACEAVDGAADDLARSTRRVPGAPDVPDAVVALHRTVDAWARLVARKAFHGMEDPWRRGISRDDVEQIAVVAGRRAITRHEGLGPLSAYVFTSVTNAATNLFARSQVLELSSVGDDGLDVVDVATFDGPGDLLGEAFERLMADGDSKSQRALAAAWDLAAERERITVAAIAARSDLTIGEARYAWDRIKLLLESMIGPAE